MSAAEQKAIPFTIRHLPGDNMFPSPLGDCSSFYDDQFLTIDSSVHKSLTFIKEDLPIIVEKAGPRKTLYFDPPKTTVAITTAGGLSPGLNNVIRSLVNILWWRYGVRRILGLRYGFEGLNPEIAQVMELTPTDVRDVHRFGGTMLGTSRGPQKVPVMVDFLVQKKIDILFTIGGDGTQKGALEIESEIARRGLRIGVVGIPKTIDNDLACTERTFGFQTAVQLALASLEAAHEEARGARNGVGLVKLMGRDSGFIALHAALANCDVNLLLIPEVPFSTEKVLENIEQRLKERGHILIVVSEGAGQHLGTTGVDASGNVKFIDVGVWLKSKIEEHLKSKKMEHTVKYIDPSYTIRSAPTVAQDSVFCVMLAHQAAHAALSGKTGMMIGVMNDTVVHVPMERAVVARKKVNVDGLEYRALLDSTGMQHCLLLK